jgi:hypothetical protein
MAAFNAILSSVFDVLLAPLGHGRPWFDLLAWPLLGGVVALLVIKAVSNQAGITRAKNFIQVHLLEIVLFRDNLRVVLPATAKALGYNLQYLGFNIVPMLVMIVPMTAILVQLVAHYGYAPAEVGRPITLVAELDGKVGGVRPADVTLELPPGVELDAPPVRTAGTTVAWRLRPTAPGDHVLKVHAGDRVEEKRLSAGGEARKVSVLRTKGLEAILYPAEPVPAPDSPIYSLSLMERHDQPLGFLPAGESGILLWFFAVSLLAGFLLKDFFGVTL